MRRYEIVQKIEEVGVVAVVRGDNWEGAVEVSEAVIAGGINAIELTFTVPGVEHAIKAYDNTVMSCAAQDGIRSGNG